MPEPAHNLPSPAGQRDYMLVQQAPSAYHACGTSDGINDLGFEIAIRHQGHSKLAQIYYSNYVVNRLRGHYYISDRHQTYELVHANNPLTGKKGAYLRMSRLALYYATNPHERAESVRRLMQLVSSDIELYSTNTTEHDKDVSIAQKMLSKRRNDLNDIDRNHTRILLNSIDVTRPEYDNVDLQPYVSQTYVNMVYGCGLLCSHSALLDQALYYFDTIESALLCERVLLEERGILTHDGQAVTQHDYNITTFNTTTQPLVNVTTDAAVLNTTLQEQGLICATPQACTSVLPIAFSVSVITMSTVALFVAHSDNIVSRSIRSCVARVGNALTTCATSMCAMRRIPQQARDENTQDGLYDSVPIEEPERG